jgi:hypothetical protein
MAKGKMAMTKIDLAPCPHCGGTDVYFSWRRNPREWGPGPCLPRSEVEVFHYVVCRSCQTGTDPCKTHREAATCWNDRTGYHVLLWCRSCLTCTDPCKMRRDAATCRAERTGYRVLLRHVLPWATMRYTGERNGHGV